MNKIEKIPLNNGPPLTLPRPGKNNFGKLKFITMLS